MALQGTLILNEADYAPFNLYGVGVFMAHSGQGAYRNNGACGSRPNLGPLPPGKYWIVDRVAAARWTYGWAKALASDLVGKTFKGAEFSHDEWFALYRDELAINDQTWINGISRGAFRLHPGTLSEGCITIAHNSDFAIIRDALMNTSQIQVPCMRSLMARGWVEVVDGGFNNTCP